MRLQESIEIGHIDDKSDILELSKLILEKENESFNVSPTRDPEELFQWVKDGELDAVISDYEMPDKNGIDILRDVRSEDSELPFFLYTGISREEVAKEAVNTDATGYFQKQAGTDHYSVIANSIESAVDNYREKERNEILSSIVEMSENPMMVTDSDSRFLYVNTAFEEQTGYSEEEVQGENPNILNSGNHDKEEFEEMYEVLLDGEQFTFEDLKNVDSEGHEYVHDLHLVPVEVQGDSIDYFAGISVIH